MNWLKTVWPRLDVGSDPTNPSAIPTLALAPATSGTLNGNQCLVFFLGGIPSKASDPAACLGFSRNPSYPAGSPAGNTSGADESRYGPYFNFKSARLFRHTNGFFSYVDAYNQRSPDGPRVYAYFSSRRGNDYTNDCPNLPTNPTVTDGPLTPYTDGKRFINPNGFQIICAGIDGLYGPGGLWNATTGETNPTSATVDNLTNFSGLRLGAPQS